MGPEAAASLREVLPEVAASLRELGPEAAASSTRLQELQDFSNHTYLTCCTYLYIITKQNIYKQFPLIYVSPSSLFNS